MQDIFGNFGLYLHVPFCAKNCAYCRFYKRVPTRADIDEYLDCIKLELDLRTAENGGALPRPQTAFWGGGTPSCLPADTLERLAEILSPVRPSLEWTVEVAPTTATPEKLRVLKKIGATRISMGVQSFNPQTLESLGRSHTLDATLHAIDTVASADFPHFSIDLIFGAAGQNADEWRADLARAAEQPVDHISAYCLEFESGTSNCCGKTGSQTEREREADFYEIAADTLPAFGFAQYEISNYSRPDCECLHNLSTWHMAQWLGLGPAAASQWRGLRSRNTPDLDSWARGIRLECPQREDIVKLDDAEMLSSALIFGLRMNRGVNLDSLRARFPSADFGKYEESLAFLKSEGLADIGGDSTLSLTARGRLLADAVAVELL